MDLSEAASIIAAALSARHEGEDPLRDAAQAVFNLAERSQLLGIIHAIRNDPTAVHRCAALSHRHPLGHDKIMLIDTEPSFNLRMHAWWRERPPSVEHVHHHRFSLATALVRGNYDMQVFQRVPSGIRVVQYRQNSSADATEWYLTPAGTVHLRLLTTAKIAEGVGYTLAADALHRVMVPPGSLCLTLFLAVTENANLSVDTRVFALPGSAAPALIKERKLTADDYRRRLDAITAELTDSN